MDQEELVKIIENIMEQQVALQEEIARLVETVTTISEENNRLKMLNQELTEDLATSLAAKSEDIKSNPLPERPPSNRAGRDRLQGFYDDGIHVCHELFGKRRESDEDCLFCQSVIMRLEQSE